jgi:hypothetical protein
LRCQALGEATSSGISRGVASRIDLARLPVIV